MTKKRHPSHAGFARLPDDRTRLEAAITGDPEARIPGVRVRMEQYLPWRRHGSLVVRFENLIGEEGGGTRSAQRLEVQRLACFIGVDLSDEQVDAIAEGIFDRNSRTFRRGMIDDWKNYFDDDLKNLFKEKAGAYLIDLGYETNMMW